jgi:hypothetical protein
VKRVAESLSDEQIQQRIPIWCALAELFLDTELQPADFARIAAVIVQARLSVEQAEKILNEEVAPAFTPNMLGAAGEWAGWSEDFVRERIMAHLNAWAVQRAIARFRARRHRTLYISAWKEMARHLTQGTLPCDPNGEQTGPKSAISPCSGGEH